MVYVGIAGYVNGAQGHSVTSVRHCKFTCLEYLYSNKAHSLHNYMSAVLAWENKIVLEES